MEICQDSSRLLEMGQKYRALYMKNQVRFAVSGYFNHLKSTLIK
jgi:hypothetical protein